MALMDLSANLMHPAQQNLAGALNAMMIEKFDGRVHEASMHAVQVKPWFPFVPLIGTDTMSNAAMGRPTINKVTPGVEPQGYGIEVGKNIVEVKTPIICRVVESMIEKVQDRLDIKGRTPANFGREIGNHTDRVLLVQTVKSAMTASGPVSDIPGGITLAMDAIGDETDADKLEIKFRLWAQTAFENEVDVMRGIMFVQPFIYHTLLDSDKLINADFSPGNGNFAEVKIMKAGGLRLQMTNRFSLAEDTGAAPVGTAKPSIGYLYGTNYNTSVGAAKVIGNFITDESIMVAEAIPLTSKVWWSDQLLCWFIDAFTAFGGAPDRSDQTGALFKVTA